MKRAKRAILSLCVAALFMGGSNLRADDAAVGDQIKRLESEIASLKAQVARQAGPQSTEQAVLRDADSRNFFDTVAPSATSGYDGKSFVLTSPDGSFTMKPGLSLQIRDVLNYRDSGKSAVGKTTDDWQSGLEVRRAKFWITGQIFNKFTYKFQLTNDRNAAGINLDDAYIETALCKNADIRIGAYKLPWSLEEGLVSDIDQLGVDRSLLNDSIGQNSFGSREQAISVYCHSADPANDPMHAVVSFSDGDNSNNTDFRDRVDNSNPTQVVERSRAGVAGRVDYLVKGSWSDHAVFTAKGTKADTLVVGAGALWNDGQNNNIYRFTVDAQYVIANKLNIYAAWLGTMTDIRHATSDSRFDQGLLIQAGYLLDPKWEAFGRFDITLLDDEFVKTDNQISEFTVGFNRYLGTDGAAGNRARLSFDVTYQPSGPGASDKTAVDSLANRGRNEVICRAMFQIRL